MAESEGLPSVAGKGSALLKKRVFGVPVLYLAILAVTVVAVYAWRAKASTSDEPVSEEDVAADDPLAEELLPKMPVGTVITMPGPTTGSNSEIETNDEWLRKGVAYLLTKGRQGGVAQTALANYLDGAQLTYDQGVMRDLVIAQYGLPPTILPTGTTLPRPAPKPVPKVPPVIPKTPPVKPPRVDQSKAHPWPGKSIGMGDKGGNVSFIQNRTQSKVTGVFDKWTELHVRQWQARQRLPQDGRIDKQDWIRMFPPS